MQSSSLTLFFCFDFLFFSDDDEDLYSDLTLAAGRPMRAKLEHPYIRTIFRYQ